MVPLPLYTCVHVKKDVSALTYCGKLSAKFLNLLSSLCDDLLAFYGRLELKIDPRVSSAFQNEKPPF